MSDADDAVTARSAARIDIEGAGEAVRSVKNQRAITAFGKRGHARDAAIAIQCVARVVGSYEPGLVGSNIEGRVDVDGVIGGDHIDAIRAERDRVWTIDGSAII